MADLLRPIDWEDHLHGEQRVLQALAAQTLFESCIR